MVNSHPVPSIGDTVVLNDGGLEQLFGLGLVPTLQHMKTLRMKITGVAEESLTKPEQTFDVSVDNPEIDMMLIDHWMFDVVEKASDVPKFEHWGTPSGREGIQRTLVASDEADMGFLDDGIRIVGDDGVHRKLTVEEAESMGIRRVVAAKNVRTGEMKGLDKLWNEKQTPIMVVPGLLW